MLAVNNPVAKTFKFPYHNLESIVVLHTIKLLELVCQLNPMLFYRSMISLSLIS
jgi:hypothetical protein